MDYKEFYDECEDFRNYVQRLIKCRALNESVEEVLKFKIVHEVAKYYKEILCVTEK